MVIRTRENSGSDGAIHRRRQLPGKRSVRAVRRYDRALVAGREMNPTAIDLSIIWPALIAGLLVTATHVPLGMQVLGRGIVFIDLAIAQIAGLGVIGADWLGWEPQGAAMQAAA